jgi:DNA polymerase-3 subunit alpha
MVKKKKFCNMHHHNTMSFGDGFGTAKQHAERAAELGYQIIAATDHGNVSSHFQLEKAANKVGLKAVFGVEAYCGSVDPDTRTQFKNHLTILAMDAGGYRSLNRIVTQSWRDYYYHPTVSETSLRDNNDGLIVLSGCSGSRLACAMLGGKGTEEHNDTPDLEAAAFVVEQYQAIFGERYYLEIQPFYELERSCTMNQSYVQLSQWFDIPLVVTHDVHYPRMEDAEMQAVLHAARRGGDSVDDAMRKWNYDVPLTLPSKDSHLASRLMKTGLSREDAWQAIENSEYVASLCNVTLPKAERLRYPVAEKDLEPWT